MNPSESGKNRNKKRKGREEGKGGGAYENDRFPRFGTNSLKKEEEEEEVAEERRIFQVARVVV